MFRNNQTFLQQLSEFTRVRHLNCEANGGCVRKHPLLSGVTQEKLSGYVQKQPECLKKLSADNSETKNSYPENCLKCGRAQDEE